MVTQTLRALHVHGGPISALPRSLSAAVHRLQPVDETSDELGEVLRPNLGLAEGLENGLVGA